MNAQFRKSDFARNRAANLDSLQTSLLHRLNFRINPRGLRILHGRLLRSPNLALLAYPTRLRHRTVTLAHYPYQKGKCNCNAKLGLYGLQRADHFRPVERIPVEWTSFSRSARREASQRQSWTATGIK